MGSLTPQLEQLEYDAARAFEQYNEVDARNRLVASELERRWNVQLEAFESARASLAELECQRHPCQRKSAMRRWRSMYRTSEEDLDVIRKMAPRYGDSVIANVLKRLGRRTGKEHRVDDAAHGAE